MTNRVCILVAVDDCVASERAVQNVPALIDGKRDFLVCLLYGAPAMPPGMRACGGEESPKGVPE